MLELTPVLLSLKQALKADSLILPPDYTTGRINHLIKRLYNKSWSVRIQEPYSHGRSVAHYLSRYITGGPIKAGQLHYANERQVAFWYKDHRDQKTKELILNKDEFIRRILLHVPEPGQHSIRYYGLYAASSKGKENADKSVPVPRSSDHKTVENTWRNEIWCQKCGGVMQLILQTFKGRKKGNSIIKSQRQVSCIDLLQQDAVDGRARAEAPLTASLRSDYGGEFAT